MNRARVMHWLARPWTRTSEARRELEASQADAPSVHELADDLSRLRSENHITRRVHIAIRGGGRP